MSENIFDASSGDLNPKLEEKITKIKTNPIPDFKGLHYLNQQCSSDIPNDSISSHGFHFNEPTLKSEKIILYSNEKIRDLYPHSFNSKNFTVSIKSSKGFYDVIARFYLAKKFINNLRTITSTRSLKFLTVNNLKMINDPIYFPFSKEISKIGKFLRDYHFDPSSVFTLIFTFLNFIIIGFYFVYIPLALCVLTLDNNNYQYLDYMHYMKTNFVLFLIIDVFRRLNTAYYKKGLLVTNKKFIFRKYIKRYLLFDFLSLIPLALTELSLKSSLSEFFLILFYFKFKHFNELILKFEEVILMHSKLNNILSLLKLVLRLIFLSHIFACLWFYLGKTTFYENSWIKDRQLENQPDSYIFLYSYYFVCVTMNTVGYGDIHPTNPLETLFAIIFIYVACILFAYTLNSIGLILENINKSQKEYLKEVHLVNNFMREKNINFDLRIRVRKYFEYIWTEEKIHKAKEQACVIQKLSDSLKEELYIEAYGHIIRNVKFLSLNFSEESLRKIVPILKERRYTPGDFIFLDDDFKDYDLYVITKGSVELFISSESNQSYTTVKKLEAGEVFGEFAFMTGLPRKTGARSIDFTTIYCIKQNEFLHILKKNKIDYENYCRMRDSMLLYDDYHLMYIKCSSCKLPGHLVGKCPLIHYAPPTDIILRRHNYSEDQMRMLNYDRSELRKRFNVKKNFNLVKSSVLFFQKNNREILESGLDEMNEDESLKSLKVNNREIYSAIKSKTFNLNIDDHMYCSLHENEEDEENNDNELKVPSMYESKTLERIKTKTGTKNSHEENFPIFSKSRNLDENNDEPVPQASSLVLPQKKKINTLSNILDILKNYVSPLNEKKDETYQDILVNFEIMKSYSSYFPQNNIEKVLQKIKKNQNRKFKKRKSIYILSKAHNWNEERKKFKSESRINFFRNKFFQNEKILEQFNKEEELDPIYLKTYFKKLYEKKNILKRMWNYLVEIYYFCFFERKKVTRLTATTSIKFLKDTKEHKH